MTDLELVLSGWCVGGPADQAIAGQSRKVLAHILFALVRDRGQLVDPAAATPSPPMRVAST